MTLVFLAIIGIIVGAVTNWFPLLNDNLFNFSLSLLIFSYDSLAVIIHSLPRIPEPIIVFLIAYGIGTFLQKILVRYSPIPIVRKIAQIIGGVS